MELPFMTVFVTIFMAFPVLRLLYMDQQFENYLVKIKLIRDRAVKLGDQTTVQKAATIWKHTLKVSGNNRTSVKHDFVAVSFVLLMGWAIMNEQLELIPYDAIVLYLYGLLGVAGGQVLGTFTVAFKRMNKIKTDVNEIIFEI